MLSTNFMLFILLTGLAILKFVFLKPLNVALLCAVSNPNLTSKVGCSRVAGAVTVAWDRVVQEGLLPQYDALNLTIEPNDCIEAQTVGSIINFITDGVDVALGPACSLAAMAGGTIGKFYDWPLILWGPQWTSELLDQNQYSNIMASSSSSIFEAAAIMRILNCYNWQNIAIVYYLEQTFLLPRCSIVIPDLEEQISDSNATVVLKQELKDNSYFSFQNVFDEIKPVSRVTILCFESAITRRNFLLSLADSGLADDKNFVWILVESRRAGYNNIWIDTNVPPDGRDEDAKRSASRVFVIDNQLGNSSPEFIAAVIDTMTQPPYDCSNCTDIDPKSTNVGELADAMYLYALARNASALNGIMNPTGTQLSAHAQGTFQGFSGSVIINENGTRVPRFNLWAFDSSNAPAPVFILTEFLDDNQSYTLELLVNETTLWESRGGFIPSNIPPCGYDGSLCPPSFMESYFIPTVCCGVILLLTIISTVVTAIWFLRARKEEEARLNSLWNIAYSELKPIAAPSNAKSTRSMQSYVSLNTRTTEISIEKKRLFEDSTHSYYKLHGKVVVARKHEGRLELSNVDCANLRRIRLDEHENLCRFLGLSIFGHQFFTIWKYCKRGSIKEVIARSSYQIDWFFKYSFVRDITEGVAHIHRNYGPHGWLSSATCLVDDRWKVKITFYDLQFVKNYTRRKPSDCIWLAPEQLRDINAPASKSADIYSLAIIFSEILNKKPAWDLDNQNYDLDELIIMLKRGGASSLRPKLELEDEHDAALAMIIRDCWMEQPDLRPDCEQLKKLVHNMNKHGSSNLLDHVFRQLEDYALNLEEEVQARLNELNDEKKKGDALLYRMLPKQVADRLKLGCSVEPEAFDCVTLFFSDVVSFTTIASKCTPLQVVTLLNDLYTTFDAIIDLHDVYKVETIGDGYLCVSGLPHRNGQDHASEISKMSILLLEAIKKVRVAHLPNEIINIRIGLHTGSVVTGVVGVTMPRYCLFGDSVMKASKMESNGQPGRIHISPETHSFLSAHFPKFRTEPRGEVILKGGGVLETYWLLPDDQLVKINEKNNNKESF